MVARRKTGHRRPDKRARKKVSRGRKSLSSARSSVPLILRPSLPSRPVHYRKLARSERLSLATVNGDGQRKRTPLPRHDVVYVQEEHGGAGSLRELILGGQDGLVNVLGVILGVASATSNTGIVLVAGVAAALAESVSMAAVAYTSSKAALEFYESERARENKEIDNLPEVEKQEIRDIYYAKGFRGKDLERVVKVITSDRERWIDTMMTDELRMLPDDFDNPVRSAVIVGVSALIGSLIPLIPFILLPDVGQAMVASVILAVVTLFAAGWFKAKVTIGSPLKSALELAFIGTLAALVGYAVGVLFGMAHIV